MITAPPFIPRFPFAKRLLLWQRKLVLMKYPRPPPPHNSSLPCKQDESHVALYREQIVSRSSMCHFLKGPIPDGKDKSGKELSDLYQTLHKQKNY